VIKGNRDGIVHDGNELEEVIMFTVVTGVFFLAAAVQGQAGPPVIHSAPHAAKSVVSVLDFGASPGGTKDSTEAFRKALESLRGIGGTAKVPRGRYLLSGSVTVPSGVALEGTWRAPHHGGWREGSTLLVTAGHGSEKGPAAVELEQSSSVRGFTVIYPKQRLSSVVPYPWTFHGKGMHVTIENVTLVNSYNGIAMGPEGNELHLIRNVFGCVLRRGVFIDRCTDIGRIENVHFNPHYWLRAAFPESPGTWKAKLEDGRVEVRHPQWYMQKHLEAFIFGRTDWEYVLNTFVFGAKVGYLFTKTPNGAPNGNFLGIGADWCGVCLKAEATQRMGVLVTNGEFVGNRESESAVVVTDGVLQLCNSNFWGFQIRNVSVSGDHSAVSLNQCFFRDWGPLPADPPAAVEARGGVLTVQGSSFMRDRPHIYLGKEVRSAVVFGNTFVGGAHIKSEARGDVKIDLNVTPFVPEKKEK